MTELCASTREDILSAARRLTGHHRRAYQAEMAVKHCGGNARRAEAVFGWGRDSVGTGLGELRTGIRCVESFVARGRHRSEESDPELAVRIHALAGPESQADPKFQTPLAYTRITARAVREALAAGGTGRPVPAERTVSDILNRMGYRLRRVRKTLPQKNSPKPIASSTICAGSTDAPRGSRKRSASRSTPRPR